MEINLNLFFWLEMIRFVSVGVVLIMLAFNMSYFLEVFENIDSEISGMLLWALFMLYALTFFKAPELRGKGKENQKKK